MTACIPPYTSWFCAQLLEIINQLLITCVERGNVNTGKLNLDKWIPQNKDLSCSGPLGAFPALSIASKVFKAERSGMPNIS